MYFVEQQGAELLNECIAHRAANGAGIEAENLRCLVEASKRQQIMMAKAVNNEPLGSIAYARISKYTLRLIANNPEHKLLPNEFQEGKILFIVDGFFKINCIKRSLANMGLSNTGSRIIAYVRKGKLRVIYNDRGRYKLVTPKCIFPRSKNLSIAEEELDLSMQ